MPQRQRHVSAINAHNDRLKFTYGSKLRRPWPAQLDAERLTQLFRRLVLKMLVRKRRLSPSTAQKLLGWEHSGYSVFVGEPIEPQDFESRRRLARYLVKAPLSLERLRYGPATCRVAYGSSKRAQQRSMAAVDFLAELSAMIPDRGQHLVSHWGRCTAVHPKASGLH